LSADKLGLGNMRPGYLDVHPLVFGSIADLQRRFDDPFFGLHEERGKGNAETV
jgi:hypothetical protein